jgi:hypothetical protein
MRAGVVAIALLAGCNAPTTLRLEIDPPSAVTIVSLSVSVDVDGIQRMSEHTNPTLPADTLVLLPDLASPVAITVVGTDASGGTFTASGSAQSQPHAETHLVVTLGNDCPETAAPPDGIAPVQCAMGHPPVIDGDVSDWMGANFLPLDHRHASPYTDGNWSGDAMHDDADSSGQFALRWDADNLYLAIEITDDIRAVHPGEPPFNDDSVEIYFDGKGDRTITYGADDYHFMIAADGRSAIANGQPAPSGMQFHTSTGSPSWSFEFAIPWSALQGGPAAIGHQFGFDVAINDDDNLQQAQLKHFLYWRGPTFNNGMGPCVAPYCDTQQFGTAQLAGR